MNETKKFEDVLDESLERLVKGEKLDQVLQRFPEHADHLRPLLETVSTARSVAPVQPRPEFRQRARLQLDSALREKNLKKSRPWLNIGWQPTWAVAMAVILVLSLAGTGTVAAARSSMPDSALYPVKLATEQVQMALTFSDLDKAELHAKLADERVNEIAYIAENHPEKIEEASENMKEHLGKITSLLGRAPVTMSAVPATGALPPEAQTLTAPAAATAPTEDTEDQEERSKALTAPVPAPAPAPSIAAAPRTPEVKSNQGPSATANESRKGDEKKDSKSDERARLKSKVEGQASNNTARLRSLLETAPETSKPALQRAIDESEHEYRKAIDAIDD